MMDEFDTDDDPAMTDEDRAHLELAIWLRQYQARTGHCELARTTGEADSDEGGYPYYIGLPEAAAAVLAAWCAAAPIARSDEFFGEIDALTDRTLYGLISAWAGGLDVDSLTAPESLAVFGAAVDTGALEDPINQQVIAEVFNLWLATPASVRVIEQGLDRGLIRAVAEA